MMKNKAAGAALAAMLVASGAARAEVPVVDNASIIQQAKSYLQEIKAYAVQLQQLQQQVQTVMWAANTFQSFVHDPSLGTAMAAMGSVGITNPLPINPYAMQGLISGAGGVTGAMGNLGALTTGTIGTNQVYSCTGGGWVCQESQRNAAGIGGSQGIAMQVAQQVAAHFPVLDALRARALTATTPKDVQDVQVQLAAEQAWQQGAQAQLQAAAMMASAEHESREQRQNEWLDQQIDQALAQGGVTP